MPGRPYRLLSMPTSDPCVRRKGTDLSRIRSRRKPPEQSEITLGRDLRLHRRAETADDRPAADVELALYRITQEAIANAQAHSGGSLVQVEATIETARILIAVADDGAGIDAKAVDAAQRASHFGLASMRQRAAAIGADLRVESDGDGTSVRVEWRR
jgi:signal transduction histidine kinase